MKQLGYVQDTSIDTAQGLPTIPDGAQFALFQAEGQALRWRDDGTNPTVGVGFLLAAGESFLYDLGPLSKVKIIAAVAGGIVNVSYYSS